MPLTSTRTPVTADHASWTRSHATRFARWFLVAAVVVAGGSIAAGVEVGINSDSELVTAGENIATIGIALVAGEDGDPVDVLVR